MADALPLYTVAVTGLDPDGVPRLLACDVDGNLTLSADVDIDTTGLATSAKQDSTLAATLPPGTLTAITPSDSTPVTSTCSRGIFVSVTGNVNVTGTGGSAVSLGTQVAGTKIELALSRVNAATTATVIGLS